MCGRSGKGTVQSVVVYSSITFHINGKHDSLAPYPNTVTGVMSCVSVAWYFCVATRWLKYQCYRQAPLRYCTLNVFVLNGFRTSVKTI